MSRINLIFDKRLAIESHGTCKLRESGYSSVHFLKSKHNYRGFHILRDLMMTHRIRYNDVIINAMASQITSLAIVYSTVYSGTDERKHQSSASLAFVRGIHRWPVNSPHKGTVTRNMFPIDDVIILCNQSNHCFLRYLSLPNNAIGPCGNCVLSSGTKPWPEPMIVYCQLYP